MMKEVTEFRNKRVLVLGLAKSGMSAAKLLKQLGTFVIVNDMTPLEKNAEAKQLMMQYPEIKVVLGEHPVSLFEEEQIDYVVKNPGINYENIMVKTAQKLHIPILTEVELAWYVSEADILGITGTNGKTTTTMMINQVFNHYQNNYSILAGNIGYPASTQAVSTNSTQILTTELSSFQLMGIEKFHPHVALITNIYEAHLDYHHTREEYVQAKWQIQKNMTSDDYLVLNGNQEELLILSKDTRAQVVYFARDKRTNGAHTQNGRIFYQDEHIMDIKELSLPGEHNLENALATISVAKIYEIPTEIIKDALSNFAGVEHRMQFIGKYDDVSYYNDSKATNILSTRRALSGFDNNNLILIAGGLDRNVDFSEMADDLKNLKALVTFGEVNDQLGNIGKQLKVPTYVFKTLDDATKKAINLASPGDKVLLSPANASWDQYKNFEERGQHFTDLVTTLVKEK